MLAGGAAVHVFGLASSAAAAGSPAGDRHAALAALAATPGAVGAASLHLHDLPEQAGHVALAPVLARLAELGCNEVHLEAGARLNAAFIAADLVDEYLCYLAPKLIGPGRPLAELPTLPDLAQAPTLVFHDVQPVGPDLRILARPAGRLLDRTRAKP
jgi:diaminohydroxyphosphoribosylaminopyrimidine deaminase/5-amino-6-(5-phosphoribosylamino)uracil reductase